MEIIVHHPETPEKMALLEKRVAKFHAEYVADYIEKLQCPTWQKLKLIDAIANAITETVHKVEETKWESRGVRYK